MIASRSMRMAPRTDCSASRLWGGRRSIIGLPWSWTVVTTDCHGRRSGGEDPYRPRIPVGPAGAWTPGGRVWTGCGRRLGADGEQLPATDRDDEASQARVGQGPGAESGELL